MNNTKMNTYGIHLKRVTQQSTTGFTNSFGIGKSKSIPRRLSKFINKIGGIVDWEILIIS